MKWFKQNKLLCFTIITAIYCMMIITFISLQEKHIDKACQLIKEHDNKNAKIEIDKIFFIDELGQNKETVLMSACESGNTQIIQYLLNKGASPNKTIDGNLSPLEIYCKFGYKGGLKPLQELLDHGAQQSLFSSKPAIFHLGENFKEMDEEEKKFATEMSIYLLTNGAPLTYKKETVLHLAAKGNMSELFDQIVHTREGLQLLNSENNDKLTPWQTAVNSGSIGVQRVIRNLETEYSEIKETENENNSTGDALFDELLESGIVDIQKEDEIQENDDTEQNNKDKQEETKKGYYQELYGD